ncbi:MAG TPA: FAD-dependent oxidoreductase [Candidatus Paceibacterota bacterium]|nr:FAD-dependent oxidoreductase [Candidatus Paceibacterota bacterium]
MFDLAIVGGGPAGAAAAVYAARKRLKTVFITAEWGGQSTVSSEIQNWVGTTKISGADLAKNLRAHVETYAADIVTVVSPIFATSLATFDDHIEITTDTGEKYEAKTLLVASGSKRRKLDVPGADTFDQKGLTYCATCDGPLFDGQDVAVIGGGNAALETVLQLLAYCKSVTLLNRSDTLRADEVTVAAAQKHQNFRIIENAQATEVVGEKFVTGLRYKDTVSSEETLLPVTGVFVEIGLLPNTEWLGSAVALTPFNQIIVDPKTQRTSHRLIWAAGDCTDGLYHQNNIAAGDAVKALEDIYMSIHRG